MADKDEPGINGDEKSAALNEADIRVVQNETLKQRRREQICDAALELFLEKGFASTTIRDICARSGVNQASIYDYIANKNDILRRLLNQLWFRTDVPTLPSLLGQTDRDLEDVLREYYRETWDKKGMGALLVYRTVPHMQKVDRQAMRERERTLIEDAAGELRKRFSLGEGDPRFEILANLLVYLATFGPMRSWLQTELPVDVIVHATSAAAAAMIRQVVDQPQG
ncbi:TetR family transcriptional regulator [Breoghania corrubedonensis]|uniref:TetR family transcriptional regulator n=1 Tax=Breoghania corrubedonensis TaxID=665038 RepID=A0A2T5US75_9HYPH|nr:TetR/AcrR family transcriptional regulator [Breoghania corrubedonensis]PTW54362.1 TetR family transcriptional regulator [Breoghania corrubedonensis]